jgi:hypothetical protein
LNDTSPRDVLDKLGIKPGSAVAFVEAAGQLDADLRRRVLDRTGRGPAGDDEAAGVVLATIDSSVDVTALLREWKARIAPNGGIWLLTPKHGLPGHVNQSDLIRDGLAAGLVDNKNCSVSDTTGGLRFCFRLADRPS